jgi:hypothetical protein
LRITALCLVGTVLGLLQRLTIWLFRLFGP